MELDDLLPVPGADLVAPVEVDERRHVQRLVDHLDRKVAPGAGVFDDLLHLIVRDDDEDPLEHVRVGEVAERREENVATTDIVDVVTPPGLQEEDGADRAHRRSMLIGGV